MTLDEAIEFCNEKSKNIKLRTEPKTFEQIAEWLEELKILKSLKNCSFMTIGKTVEQFEQEIRNKAIDDFANGISECLGVENATKYGNKNAEQQRMSYDTLMKYEIADAIEDVAEQLKAGDGE